MILGGGRFLMSEVPLYTRCVGKLDFEQPLTGAAIRPQTRCHQEKLEKPLAGPQGSVRDWVRCVQSTFWTAGLWRDTSINIFGEIPGSIHTLNQPKIRPI